jgi:hypothetical protein
MSLFSFANISFGSKDRSFGVNQNTLGTDSKFGYDIYRYPIDLGSMDKGHYMMFHINKQISKSSQVTSGVVNGVNPTVIQNRILNNLPTVANLFGSVVSRDLATSFTRTIRRVEDSVALYMPDTLQFTHNQQYGEPSLSGDIAAGLATLSQGGSITDAFKKLQTENGDSAQALKQLVGNFSPAIAQALQSRSSLLSAGFTAFTGVVINPMLEMIYSSPEFREFRFDFMFYPRSEREAAEVQRIISRFQYHQAPEIINEGAGFFLIPPSEFDIMFYYNGSINPNIPKISTCVLKSIDIDYAPNGQFSAYEVQGQTAPTPGGTGMPVGIRMSLQFKETEILTKKSFDPNSYTSNLSRNKDPGYNQVNDKGEGLF